MHFALTLRSAGLLRACDIPRGLGLRDRDVQLRDVALQAAALLGEGSRPMVGVTMVDD